MEDHKKSRVTLRELQWDTDFFGVTCARAILQEPVSMSEWTDLNKQIIKYQFVSIKNYNSDPWNSQLIGQDTTAFLADVNIQFEKNIESPREKGENIELFQGMEKNEQVLILADFKYSKFFDDYRLKVRGGDQVYQQWILNSFEKPDKYFALSRNERNQLNGFLLYSLKEDACVIELIAVDQNSPSEGIGTRLFQSIEYEVYKRNLEKIRVGTQVRNKEAVNFYHKMGCRQTASHQIYHLWNF